MRDATTQQDDRPLTFDPPIRADGRCVVCLGARGQLPKIGTQRSKRQLAVELAKDPFCSTVCARKWHSNELAGQPGKAPAADLDWTHA